MEKEQVESGSLIAVRLLQKAKRPIRPSLPSVIVIGYPSRKAIEEVLRIWCLLSTMEARNERQEVFDGNAIGSEIHARALVNVTQARQQIIFWCGIHRKCVEEGWATF